MTINKRTVDVVDDLGLKRRNSYIILIFVSKNSIFSSLLHGLAIRKDFARSLKKNLSYLIS